jgi:hypothetical protein
MHTDELLQRVREQRLITIALADQVKEDRWRAPLLPGGSMHDVLAHLLGWDEWAMAVFDITGVRPLPPILVDALKDIDGYNARSQKRYANLSRNDLLTGLETMTPRLLASAHGRGVQGWDGRRVAELGEVWAAMTGRAGDGPRAPSIKGLLRMLYEHEKAHDDEISATLGIHADLDQFQAKREEQAGS